MSQVGAHQKQRDTNVVTGAIALAVKRLRIAHGLTQDGLADAADMDRSHISQLERGLRSPSLETLLRIAAGLGITFVQLAQEFESALESMQPGRPVQSRSAVLALLPSRPGRPGRRISKSPIRRTKS